MTVPNPLGVYSDAARRVYDAMMLHHQALSPVEIMMGRWMAFRLADGHSNLTAYPSFDAAVRDHSPLMMPYGYPRIILEGPTLRECESLVKMWRAAYDNGHRPMAGEPTDLFMPFGREFL